MPVANLNAYRGSYTPIFSGDNASVTFKGEDFSILFTTSAVCQIKVKVDGVYQQTMIWHTGEITATSDVFDLAYTPQHSYYDTVDKSTSENPSVLKLANPVTYGSHTVIIEAAVVTNNAFHFEALLVYSNSVKKNARDIDSTMVIGEIAMPMELEDVRNEVIVVGAYTGKFQRDGLPVNPNNPIVIRTYSKAIDLTSVYDRSSNNYLGRILPFEVYNDRILEQRRADHIALNALKAYRTPAKSVRFTIPGDPRLEPYDAIGFQDKKLNVMPQGERVWIKSISEKLENGKYTTTTEEAMPQEPIPSFESKAEPDLNAFDGEPLINIELRSQGKRIAGNDATSSGNVITIGTSPGWTDDMWIDYYFIDHYGYQFKITDSTANTLTVEIPSGSTIYDGNWNISFDPFDTDQKGAPLEIHYDQVINAKVQIWIKDKANSVIAQVAQDTWDDVQVWGMGKVQYWSGAIDSNFKDGKKGCYISAQSCDYVNPLRIVFVVVPEDPELGTIEIDTCTGGSGTRKEYRGAAKMTTTSLQHSPYGTIRILPRIQYNPPIIKVATSGNSAYSQDIYYRGRILNKTNVSGYIELTVSGTPINATDDYLGYLLLNLYSYYAIPIIGTTANNKIWIQLQYADRVPLKSAVMIVGQGATNYGNKIHDHFKSSDNGNTGLKLILSAINLYHDAENELMTNTIAPIYKNGIQQWYRIHVVNTLYHLGVWNPVGVLPGGTFPPSVNAMVKYTLTDFASGVEDGGQHYPDKGYFALFRNDFSSARRPPYHYAVIPKGPILLSKFGLRIHIGLTVIKVDATSTPYTMSKVAHDPDFYDSDGFVTIDDWSFSFKPEDYIFGESGDVILQHGQNIGWYFLFLFSFMDRAGRFTLNAFGRTDDPVYEQEKQYFYLVGWAPESGTGTLRFPSNDPDNLISWDDGIIRAALSKGLSTWA